MEFLCINEGDFGYIKNISVTFLWKSSGIFVNISLIFGLSSLKSISFDFCHLIEATRMLNTSEEKVKWGKKWRQNFKFEVSNLENPLKFSNDLLIFRSQKSTSNSNAHPLVLSTYLKYMT